MRDTCEGTGRKTFPNEKPLRLNWQNRKDRFASASRNRNPLGLQRAEVRHILMRKRCDAQTSRHVRIVSVIAVCTSA